MNQEDQRPKSTAEKQQGGDSNITNKSRKEFSGETGHYGNTHGAGTHHETNPPVISDDATKEGVRLDNEHGIDNTIVKQITQETEVPNNFSRNEE